MSDVGSEPQGLAGLEILQEEARWHILDLPALATRAVAATLRHLGLDPERVEVAILACDDARITDLNATFRHKRQTTNVLSWPAETRGSQIAGAPPAKPVAPAREPIALGDIAIAFETCLAEAEASAKPLGDHVSHLLVHGVLHLLGYDHERDADATLMEALEVEILCKLGIPNPY